MKLISIFLFLLFFPAIIFAADIQIIEVQTEGSDGSYDEYVKIRNNFSGSISLTGWKLQSRSATQERWVSRSGEGFPELNIPAGVNVIMASQNYSGTDEIWRHASRWGLSTDGGGMRLINQDGGTVAEKYWGSLESLNRDQIDQTAPVTEQQNEQQPAPETQIPEAPPQISEQQAENPPQQFNNEIIEPLSPSPVNAEENSTEEINIQISEFMPNPAGSDDGEWIEIKNLLNKNSDISGWFVDDEDGGSRPYQISPNTIIPANGFLVFYKIQTKIALNNDIDSVRILKSTGEITEKIDYFGGSEGLSYARGTNGWSWTIAPTPSLLNIISAPAPKKSAANNSSIMVYGEVIEINSNNFYILEEGGDEIKVNFSKDNLAVGDKVEIVGIIKKTKNGNQITPKQQTDIIIKEKTLVREKENIARNSNIKYYVVLGIGLSLSLVVQGWKRRELIKTRFKKITNKISSIKSNDENSQNS